MICLHCIVSKDTAQRTKKSHSCSKKPRTDKHSYATAYLSMIYFRSQFLFVNRLDIASLPDLEVQYHPPNSHLPEPSLHHENLLTLSEKLPTYSDMQNGEFSSCQPVLGTKPQSASPSQPDGESDTTFFTSLASTPRVLVPLGAGRDSLTVYEMVKKR